MSTPFDINVPVALNEDVVLNFEDGSQVVGTPEELIQAVNDGQIIGLHFNPPVIPDPNAPVDTPTPTEAAAAASDTPATDVPATDAPSEPGMDAPAEQSAETSNEAPTETPETSEELADPVTEDTAKLDEDVKTLEADEAAGKPAAE